MDTLYLSKDMRNIIFSFFPKIWYETEFDDIDDYFIETNYRCNSYGKYSYTSMGSYNSKYNPESNNLTTRELENKHFKYMKDLSKHEHYKHFINGKIIEIFYPYCSENIDETTTYLSISGTDKNRQTFRYDFDYNLKCIKEYDKDFNTIWYEIINC